MLIEYLTNRCVPQKFFKIFKRQAHKIIIKPAKANLSTPGLTIIHRHPQWCKYTKDCNPKYQTFGERRLVGKVGKATWITEGVFDMLSGLQYTNTVTFLGIPSKSMLETLSDYNIEHIILAMDNDKAGMRATLKMYPILLDMGYLPAIAQLEDSKDLNDFICTNKKLPHTQSISQYLLSVDPNLALDAGKLLLKLAERGMVP